MHIRKTRESEEQFGDFRLETSQRASRCPFHLYGDKFSSAYTGQIYLAMILDVKSELFPKLDISCFI